MIKADRFKAPAGTVGTVTLPFQYEVADVEATPEDESMAAAEVMGTLNGAMGTFKCNAAANCTVTTNAKGEVTGISNDNDWIFIPADGRYLRAWSRTTTTLRYGFWLQKTTDEDGVVTYNQVQTFRGFEPRSTN